MKLYIIHPASFVNRAFLFLVIIFMGVAKANAQVAPDPAFGNQGFVRLGFIPAATAFGADGKLITLRIANNSFLLNRYTANGLPDQSFGNNGSITTALGTATGFSASNLSIDPDGRIVASSKAFQPFGAASTVPVLILAVYNADGSTYTSFGRNGIFETSLDFREEPIDISFRNGTIAVAERVGATEKDIHLLLINVSVPTVAIRKVYGMFFVNDPTTVEILGNGKIFIGGAASPFATTGSLMLLKTNANGNPDSTFGTNGYVAFNDFQVPPLTALAIEADERAIAAAGTQVYRINAGGSRDSLFGVAGAKVINPFPVVKLVLQTANAFIAGGSLNGNFALTRYLITGIADTSFAPGGTITTDFGGTEGVQDMAVVGDRLYAYGSGILASYMLNAPPGNVTPPGIAQSNTTGGSEALQSNTTGTNNTAYGFRALWKNISGSGNSAFGTNTLAFNTSGQSNTAVGERALISNTTGGLNVAIGTAALSDATGVSGSTAVGYFALAKTTTGDRNTAVGYFALGNNINGTGNTAIGYTALINNLTGSNNTAIGVDALNSNSGGHQNVAIGSGVLSKTRGSRNIALGGMVNATGSDNIAIGVDALGNATASENIAIGTGSLSSNTTGVRNTATGFYSSRLLTTGSDNTAYGYQTLMSNLSVSNSAFGSSALRNATTGNLNTAVGYQALLANTTGGRNTALGAGALRSNLNDANTAIGTDALAANSGGTLNVATGTVALSSNTFGSANAAYGNNALVSNTTGSTNIAMGALSLGANVTGSSNVGLGVLAGYTTNSNNSTFIGTVSGALGDVSNSTALGYQTTVTASNQVRIGNSAITSIGGQVEWSTLSDGRFKQNIKEDVPGLEFINKLRPVTYSIKVGELDSKLTKSSGTGAASRTAAGPAADNSEAGKQLKQLTLASPEEQSARLQKEKVKYTGFVAQDVEEAAKNMGYDFSGVDAPKNKEDLYGLRYSAFVVPLVKSVQELSKKNEELEKKISKLVDQQQQLDQLKQLVNKLIADKGPNITNISASSAYLLPNSPNPFNTATIIKYHVPENSNSIARLLITNMKGQVIKSLNINSKGDGQIHLQTASLAAGTYTYTLYMGEEKVDSKQMVIAR